jgi:hypothetical protein
VLAVNLCVILGRHNITKFRDHQGNTLTVGSPALAAGVCDPEHIDRQNNFVRFEVFTAARIWILVFWHITQYSLVSRVLKLETASSSETSLTTYESTRCQKPGDYIQISFIIYLFVVYFTRLSVALTI